MVSRHVLKLVKHTRHTEHSIKLLFFMLLKYYIAYSTEIFWANYGTLFSCFMQQGG